MFCFVFWGGEFIHLIHKVTGVARLRLQRSEGRGFTVCLCVQVAGDVLEVCPYWRETESLRIPVLCLHGPVFSVLVQLRGAGLEEPVQSSSGDQISQIVQVSHSHLGCVINGKSMTQFPFTSFICIYILICLF